MSDSGKELGVDLYDVLVVAKDFLPSVSAEYTGVLADYSMAEAGVAGAMERSAHFGGSTLGPVHDSWLQAKQAAVGFMSSMKTSLDDTATALVRAVELYRAVDQAASDELNRQYQRHEPKPSD